MNKDIAKKIIDDIHKVPVFKRHMLPGGYFIGNFRVGTTSIWSRDIEVLVDTRRNVFKKALDEFVKQHEDVLQFAFYVCAKDCTPYLRFSVKKEYQ